MELGTSVIFNSYKHIKGYVINLRDYPDRYINTLDKLTSLGFSNITRVEAVDAKAVDVEAMLRTYGVSDLSKLGEFQNKGQMACALSHFKLLENFLGTDDEYCLVFEDDVIPHTAFSTHADFEDILWGSFDALFFGGIFCYYNFAGERHTDLAQVKKLQQNRTHLENCAFWQTHAYLCSRNFAQTAISRYRDWVNSRTPENNNCPHIDHYYSESGFFNTKLIAFQDTENLRDVRLHNMCGRKICGVLFQDNGYKSTIQPY